MPDTHDNTGQFRLTICPVAVQQPLRQRLGAQLFVDDLAFGRGVVSMQSRVNLRSIETQPLTLLWSALQTDRLYFFKISILICLKFYKSECLFQAWHSELFFLQVQSGFVRLNEYEANALRPWKRFKVRWPIGLPNLLSKEFSKFDLRLEICALIYDIRLRLLEACAL